MDRRRFAMMLAALGAAACKPSAPKAPATASPDPAPTLPPLPPIGDALALRDLLERTRLSAAMPALAGCIVQLDGEIIAATGLRQAKGAESVKLDDPWHIGADTRAMTAALYARLVEAGKLKWGATLPELFPGLTMDAAWKATTIEQVMTHTAGLADVGVRWLVARRSDTRPLPLQRLETVREALSKPPAGKPGAFAPGDTNYILVGAAIEQATRASWEDAIAAQVFKPLGMDGAGFGAPKGAAPRGHRSDASGRLIPLGDGPEADKPAALGPAGTVHLPLASWARFVRVFLDPKQSFLSADSLKRMTTPGASSPDDAPGWNIASDPELGGLLSRTGSNTLWYCTALLAPEHKAGVLLATNCATTSASKAIDALAPALLRASLPAT